MASKHRTTYVCLLFSLIGFTLFHKAYSQASWTHTSYSKRSHVLADIKGMAYDESGFLWVAGHASQTSWGQKDKSDICLQRFDGYHFQDIPLPESAHDITTIHQLSKTGKGNFYLVGHTDKGARFLLLDPYTVVFTTIRFQGFGEFIPKRSEICKFKGHHYVIVQKDGENAVLFELKGNQAAKIARFQSQDLKIDRGARFIAFRDYILISTAANGVALYDWNGKLVKAYDPNAYSFIDGIFRLKGEILFTMNQKNIFYRFSKNGKKILVAFDYSELSKYNPFRPMNDEQGRLYICPKVRKELKIYQITGAKPLLKGKFPFIKTSHWPLFYAQNFNNGFWRFNRYYQLTHFTQQKTGVLNFLPSKSIRSLYSLGKGKIIVATETSGWYVIDLNSGSVEPFYAKVGTRPISLNQTRNILPTKNPEVIWTNNQNGILRVNLKTHQADFWKSREECLKRLNSNTLVYGTFHNGLHAFDTDSKAFRTLIPGDSLWYQDIEILGNRVYATTDKGLIVYDLVSKEHQIHQLPLPGRNNFFVCLLPEKEGTFLIGSWTGKLYRFFQKDGKFKLIFIDDQKSPIASLIHYDNRLWISTYMGFIEMDPKTKSIRTHGTINGFSSNEANRYSKLATEQGLLLGTIAGLNLYAPTNHDHHGPDGELVPLSMAYYQKKVGSYVRLRNREKLSTNHSIVLPAGHHSFQLNFGMAHRSSPVLPTFKYRFDGNPWRKINNGNYLRFESLEPGKHSIELAAFNLNKNQIGATLHYTLTAEDFFYDQWWFIPSLILLLFGLVGFVIFIRLQKSKEARALRTKIASELHDELGGVLSGIFLKTDLAWRKEDDNQKKERMKKVAQSSKNAIRAMRDVVWSVDTRQDNWESLLARLREYGNELFDESDTEFLFRTTGQFPKKLSQEKKQAIYLICKEALNNCLKYAKAPEVRLSFSFSPHRATLEIIDNGVGLRGGEHFSGQGLENMKMRARQIKADFELVPSEEKGTKIRLHIPL